MPSLFNIIVIIIIITSVSPSYQITLLIYYSVMRNVLKFCSTCGIWSPPTPFITAPCIWWFIMGGWNDKSMLELRMCWNCCWWNKFVDGSSNDCGRVIVSSAGDGWRDPGVRLQHNDTRPLKYVENRLGIEIFSANRFINSEKNIQFEISAIGTSRLWSFFGGALWF